MASVVFADLSGFTQMVEGTGDEAAYIAFITEFRAVMYACIAPLLAGNRVEYAFWGDEVKVLLTGPVSGRNAADALRCAKDMVARWDEAPTNEARRRSGREPLRFKIGVATGEVTLGFFPGARAPESEGRPLCSARSLSKWAQSGRTSRIYVDGATRSLVDSAAGEVRWSRVPQRDETWEVEWKTSA
jgi:class 3 adenylate cyclase